jgi:hypothetical protein
MLSQPSVTLARPEVSAWLRGLASTQAAKMMGDLVVAFREARHMQRALLKSHPFGDQ